MRSAIAVAAAGHGIATEPACRAFGLAFIAQLVSAAVRADGRSGKPVGAPVRASSAMSSCGSVPSTLAINRRRSRRVTSMVDAARTTW